MFAKTMQSSSGRTALRDEIAVRGDGVGTLRRLLFQFEDGTVRLSPEACRGLMSLSLELDAELRLECLATWASVCRGSDASEAELFKALPGMDDPLLFKGLVVLARLDRSLYERLLSSSQARGDSAQVVLTLGLESKVLDSERPADERRWAEDALEGVADSPSFREAARATAREAMARLRDVGYWRSQAR